MTKEQLKQWRRDRQYTQKQAAAVFGKHEVTFKRWELGTRSIPQDVEIIIKLLGKKR